VSTDQDPNSALDVCRDSAPVRRGCRSSMRNSTYGLQLSSRQRHGRLTTVRPGQVPVGRTPFQSADTGPVGRPDRSGTDAARSNQPGRAADREDMTTRSALMQDNASVKPGEVPGRFCVLTLFRN
jgi:hypothetical protein